ESEPEIPFVGPGPFSFFVFQGSSEDAGRFGVQWQVLIDVAPAPVPLPAGMPLLVAALGVLGFARRFRRLS
ncbi:MAG: VPLPA-CTERM sorting domain-containing protein, partial [Litoreibacter sp.]|nr:VPLPA-CTERM sorting domain-containing protein [Litoreibacter sp.]